MVKITQKESIVLEKTLTPLLLKYGEEEVLKEIEYLMNWIVCYNKIF